MGNFSIFIYGTFSLLILFIFIDFDSIRIHNGQFSVTCLTDLRKTARRWIYILVSLGGIGYELTQQDNPRWPLIAGYVFIISVTAYALQAEKLAKTKESESQFG